MVNRSKINSPRFWKIWEESGAVDTITYQVLDQDIISVEYQINDQDIISVEYQINDQDIILTQNNLVEYIDNPFNESEEALFRKLDSLNTPSYKNLKFNKFDDFFFNRDYVEISKEFTKELLYF